MTASNTNSNDIMALNEVMKCSQCSLHITSKLHFVLHIKEVHGEKAFSQLPPPPTPDSPAVVTPERRTNGILSGVVSKEGFPCPVCHADCVDNQGKHDHVASVHAYR